MSEYSISKHGDILEKAASEFISQKFPNYELVWKEFIGHSGNGVMADLPGYKNDDKRRKFAQHTYTVLESMFMINELLISGVFSSGISSFKDYFEINKSFISFFSHVGRVKDNLERATNILIGSHAANKIKTDLNNYYQSRNVVLHGKKIPFSKDNLSLVSMPRLYKKDDRDVSWDDKDVWEDFSKFKDAYISDQCDEIFKDLLIKTNKQFEIFYKHIGTELSKEKLKIKFEFSGENTQPASGNTADPTIKIDTFISSGSR